MKHWISSNRKQLLIFAALLAVHATLVFVTLASELYWQLLPPGTMPSQLPPVPSWLLGLANAGIIVVLYGLLGLAGLWFARRLGLPGVFREAAGWRNWFLVPMALGLVLGFVIALGDRIFASLGDWGGSRHPPFPTSLIASATAGIGEEILFRAFVMGLWAFLADLALRRWKATEIALWIGNVIGALAFAAGHIPAAMVILGVSSPAGIPPLALAEMLILNGIVSLVAGQQYVRNGLVAAVGVHFWADVVWHVVWPLVATG